MILLHPMINFHNNIIMNFTVIRCEEVGCPRRCGGQGDLLSGTIGLFAVWARQVEKKSVAH